MDWDCVECGLINAGGLFCIRCGAKAPQENQQVEHASRGDDTARPSQNSSLPKIVAAVTISLSFAFGFWQNSLAATAAVDVETARTDLNDAVRERNSAKQLYIDAEYEENLCFISPWCSYLTYVELQNWADTASRLLTSATANEGEMQDQLKVAQTDLAKSENFRSIAIGVGGVASLGTVLWAILADFKRRKSEVVDPL